jgi:hypothetical protein
MLSLRKASLFNDPTPESDLRFCEPTVRVPVQFLEFTEARRMSAHDPSTMKR